MKKIFVMVSVIFFGLLFILVSGETERMQDIKHIDSSKNIKGIQNQDPNV